MATTPTEVALITGAGSGIGQACALTLGRRGARVALLDVDQDALEGTVRQLVDEGIEAMSVLTDVTDESAVNAAVAQVVATWDAIDTVVASAGIEHMGTVEATTVEAFQRVLGVALVGTFITARATLPHLRRTRGTFTAIGSTTAVNGASNWSAYSAAKHGVMGLVKSMALDHAHEGVRVNAVLPGFIDTPMATRTLVGLSEAELAATDAAIPLSRRGAPSEVASAVAYLSSPEASYTTGSLLVVDGGTLAGFYEPPA